MADDNLFRQLSPRIMRGLMADFQLDAVSAAAIAGNLGHESVGFKFLQEIKPLVPGSRGGYGWAQWTGARRRAYESFCAERGLDPASYEANYGFLVWELRNTERAAIPAVRQAESLYDKVVAFELAFERASPKHKYYASRKRWADIALDTYSKLGGVTPPVTKPKPPVVKPPVTKPEDKSIFSRLFALLALPFAGLSVWLTDNWMIVVPVTAAAVFLVIMLLRKGGR